MELILFSFFALITMIISIRLSHYADLLDKNTRFGGMIIGGILLAGVTSLPELVTSISSVTLNNPRLAIGDLLGSNIFNVFTIVVLDIMFIRYRFMDKVSPRYLSAHLVLTYIYIIIIAYFSGDLIGGIFNVGVPSLVILLSFLIYIMLISKSDYNEREVEYNKKGSNVGVKFLITAIIMVIVSIFLTYYANLITMLYPRFSSSVIGAFLLGITTSLPEVVSTYTLIKIGSYNLAYANIIGSNIINFVILAISDMFLVNKIIYDFYEKDSLSLALLGLWFTVIMIYPVIRKKSIFKISYILPSICVVIMYILFWYSLFCN